MPSSLPLGARGAVIVEKKDDGAMHTTIVDASDDLILARKLPVKKTVEVGGDSFCGKHLLLTYFTDHVLRSICLLY